MSALPASLVRTAPRLVAAGLLLLLAACSGEKAAEPVKPVLVVQPGAAGAGLSAYAGEVRSREEPPLAFRIGGKLARRLVDVGDHVDAGQPLAELDASDFTLQRESARAAVASAESDLALARAELARYKNLNDRQLVSRSLYDTRVAQEQAAAARLRQARAQASVAGNQAGYATLRAPHAGVISQRLVDAGEVVAAGQPVYVLAAEGGLEVAFAVPEQRVGEFRPGLPLAVELWASGQRLPGTLREIAPAADPLTRTYAARVSFDDAAAKADVGQSARVWARDRKDGGIAVPLPAIVELNGKASVWVVRHGSIEQDGKARPALVVRRVPVRIGPYGEDKVPVLDGLKPDDWVVAAGAHLLRDGQEVKPVDRHDRVVAIGSRGAPAPAAR
jgi:multidrug efflux system membrane fusion protein